MDPYQLLPRPIACSRMYDVSPRARAAWAALFQWLAETTEIPLHDLEHSPPRPLEALWSRTDLGCVFMCGWPFSRSRAQPLPIAAPLPRGRRYAHRPLYFTDLVVRRDRHFQRLEDTFGGRVGWTAEGSHSGFNALRHHLLAYRVQFGEKLYAESIGPLLTPSRALQSVINGTVDIAPLDSYALDLITAHTPDAVHDIKIIATTVPAPIPLLVASPSLGKARAAMIGDALQHASQSDAMSPVLEQLCLSGFSSVSSSAYEQLNDRAQQALDAGYKLPE